MLLNPDIEGMADTILRAAGSSLSNYTMPATRKAIIDATRAAYAQGWNDNGTITQ